MSTQPSKEATAGKTRLAHGEGRDEERGLLLGWVPQNHPYQMEGSRESSVLLQSG